MADLAPGAPPPQDLSMMRKNFFNQRRQEAQQNVNAQGQEAQDAIQRRFSSLGAAGSGAQMGVMQKARDAAADQGRVATRDIDQGELQANMAAQEADLGRQEAQKGRDLQSQFFNTEQGNKLKQLDLAERNFQLEKEAQDFNRAMAEAEANRKPNGILSNLTDPKRLAATATDPISILGAGAGGTTFSLAKNLGFGGGGGGGGGTLICTELHRQGILSDQWFKLDGLFGRDFSRNHPATYRGYLIMAKPIVAKMRESKSFTKVIEKIFMPWCQWMAAKYDPSIKTSYRGAALSYVLRIALPIIYFINQTSLKKVEA